MPPESKTHRAHRAKETTAFRRTCRKLLQPGDSLLARFMRKGEAAVQSRDRSQDAGAPIERVTMEKPTLCESQGDSTSAP